MAAVILPLAALIASVAATTVYYHRSVLKPVIRAQQATAVFPTTASANSSRRPPRAAGRSARRAFSSADLRALDVRQSSRAESSSMRMNPPPASANSMGRRRELLQQRQASWTAALPSPLAHLSPAHSAPAAAKKAPPVEPALQPPPPADREPVTLWIEPSRTGGAAQQPAGSRMPPWDLEGGDAPYPDTDDELLRVAALLSPAAAAPSWIGAFFFGRLSTRPAEVAGGAKPSRPKSPPLLSRAAALVRAAAASASTNRPAAASGGVGRVPIADTETKKRGEGEEAGREGMMEEEAAGPKKAAAEENWRALIRP